VHTAVRHSSGCKEASGIPNRRRHTNQEVAVQIKSKDAGRKWLWGFLAVIALPQLYVVREMVAAYALFAIGFAAVAFVVGSLHMLVKCGELAVAHIAVLRHPVTNMAPVSNVAGVSPENQKAA
jgi:hypothetical protein